MACYRSKTDDNGLVKLYKCGDATSLSTGKREESILIESNIEKVIYDLVNASQTYELVETKRLVRADAQSPAFYKVMQLDYSTGNVVVASSSEVRKR
ncbi:MAG: hypothetical protein WBQ25_00125 [Nitrososphaeraceae archaeon]